VPKPSPAAATHRAATATGRKRFAGMGRFSLVLKGSGDIRGCRRLPAPQQVVSTR
jgi:hypothetical protein